MSDIRPGKLTLAVLLLSIFLNSLQDIHAIPDENRKGFIAGMAIGGGYAYIDSSDPAYMSYGRYGLGVSMSLGGAFNNRSSLQFSMKTNVFVDEIGPVWRGWIDKMQGEDIAAVGAILISPFVFAFTPVFRSHGLIGSLEYINFFKETAPSFYFSGSAGLGLLYDKNLEIVSGGFGISLGTGYEFKRKIAINCDLIYCGTQSSFEGMSVVISLKKFFY